MMAQLEITPPRNDRRNLPVEAAGSLNLVAVASESPGRGNDGGKSQAAPAVSFKLRAFGTDSRRVRYTRIAADTVGGSAAWLLQRSGLTVSRNRLAGRIAMVPKGVSDLPQSLSGILGLLHREEATGLDHEAIAAAIVALRAADAVIVGPLSSEDADAPGLLPHLAELAGRAYRALRPPSELIAHTGFGQVARRFDFIQMGHHDARWLAAGAVDVGILAQCLRQLLGGQGEFAITNFGGHGVLWADNRWWEIDPIGDGNVDEARAGAAFCAAWVVARRFLGAPAAKALSYARSAAANSILKK
jgi:hypothetical protein